MELLIQIFELLGTVTFAVSGSLLAIRKQMDLLGIIILGTITAVGGGIIRDVILGVSPPVTFVNQNNLILAATSSLILFLCMYFFSRKTSLALNKRWFDKLYFMSDTLGLGVFSVMGVQTAIENGCVTNVLLLSFVGVVTGVGGGILRDLLAGCIPSIFCKHIYASASIIGSVVCSSLWYVIRKENAMILGFFLVVIIRCLASYYRWNLPKIKIDNLNS